MNAEMFIQHQVSSLKYFYNSHVLGLYEYTKNYYPNLSWIEFIEYFSKANVDEDGCEIERIN